MAEGSQSTARNHQDGSQVEEAILETKEPCYVRLAGCAATPNVLFSSPESMSKVPIWFERKFEFSLSVELFPNLCARLRGTPARLDEDLRGRSHEILIRKPLEKWSAQEHAGHLLDLEPLWLARVEDYVAGSGQLTVADLSNRKTDEANHNARPLEQILAEFRAAREIFLKRVDELDASLFSRPIPHPRLKMPMRLVDHLYFVAEHDDHHLARIWELLP
jgi:uncharacterized damage-inducible protein DinB